MSNNQEKELERLVTELAEIEEATVEEAQETEAVDVSVYNTDATEVTPEELGEVLAEAEIRKIPSLKGYWLAVLILLLGIAGVVAYWLKLGGIL